MGSETAFYAVERDAVPCDVVSLHVSRNPPS